MVLQSDVILAAFCVVLLGYIIFQQYLFNQERRVWDAQRDTLLNRVMSKNVMEFKAAERITTRPEPTKWAPTDEDEARIDDAMRAESREVESAS